VNPPCIRNLERFRKSGCPQKVWDGKEGCPAWKELLVTPRNEPLKPKDKIGRCIDEWNLELQLTALGLMEGNQQATESFRNGMVEEGKDGKIYPKPDRGIVALLSLFQKLQERQEIISEHEFKKVIKKT